MVKVRLLWGQANCFSALSSCSESFQRQSQWNLSNLLRWLDVLIGKMFPLKIQKLPCMPTDSHPPTVLHVVDSAVITLTSGFNGIKVFSNLQDSVILYWRTWLCLLSGFPSGKYMLVLRVPQVSLLLAGQALVSKPQLIRQVIQSWLPWCFNDVFPVQDTEIRVCVISSELRYE